MRLPVVAAITCTRGRHTLLERCLGLFLKQDYEGKAYHIIFNNSPTEQVLAEDYSSESRRVILINQSTYSQTGKAYTSMDQIFIDAMSHLPEEVEIVTFFDDDDIFSSQHLSEGVKGYLKGKELGCVAYKPYYSYVETQDRITQEHNMFEPSFFVQKDHILEYGFNSDSAAYHHQWIIPLKERLYEPKDGTPTFFYQWKGGCYHISGDSRNPENLANHNKNSTDEGDGIITPTFI